MTETVFQCVLGISSLSLKGLSLQEAIMSAKRAGFDAFELVPQVFQRIKNYTPRIRRELRKLLEDFSLVTVHTSDIVLEDGCPADISSGDGSLRESSINTYLEYLELALDVGARVVTFHPGPMDKTSLCCKNRDPYMEFADIALRFIDSEELQLGYEFFDTDLIDSIGDPRFGLLFDVGHAATLFHGSATRDTLKLLEIALPVTVEIHLHGVDFSGTGSMVDHVPLSRSKAINLNEVFQYLIDTDFEGPLVFEIGIFGNDMGSENIRHSMEAREKIISSLEKS